MRYKYIGILAILSLLFGTIAAQVNDSGKPGGSPIIEHKSQRNKVTQALPDGGQPIHQGNIQSPKKNVLTDQERSQIATRTYKSIPAWQRLEELNESERENALIQFEPTGGLQFVEKKELRRIESTWNSGSFGKAISELKEFESIRKERNIAIGISWNGCEDWCSIQYQKCRS